MICKFCTEAKAKGEFARGKHWSEWKLDYPKHHLTQKVHVDALKTLMIRHGNSIDKILTETNEFRERRIQRARSNPEQIKILIDNVMLAINTNMSMLSVQHIHDHMAKYVDLPQSWRSKNYAFEFVECINSVVQTEMISSIRNARVHTLIVDESTDISVH